MVNFFIAVLLGFSAGWVGKLLLGRKAMKDLQTRGRADLQMVAAETASARGDLQLAEERLIMAKADLTEAREETKRLKLEILSAEERSTALEIDLGKSRGECITLRSELAAMRKAKNSEEMAIESSMAEICPV